MHESAVNLPLVRRLEAVSFRAWPASSVIYDGSWQIRLTGSHPSKRINSVVPLDPSDYGNCAIRLEKARKRFEDFGRPLVVRETTLMPPQLADFLIEDGWNVFEEVKVMTADISALELPETLVSLPSHDIGRFVEASLKVSGGDPALRPAVAEIVSSIKPTLGLFINEEVEGSPLCDRNLRTGQRSRRHSFARRCQRPPAQRSWHANARIGLAVGPYQWCENGLATGRFHQRSGDRAL